MQERDLSPTARGIDPRADLAQAKVKADAAKMGNSLARFVIGLLINLPLRAVVGSFFWQWFVLPVWPDARPLSIIECIGIFLTVSIFLTAIKYNGKDERTESEKWMQCLVAIPGWLTIWLIGWLFLRLVYL